MIEVLIAQLSSAGGPVLLALLALSVAATAVALLKIAQFRRMGAGRLRGARRVVTMWLAGERTRAFEQAAREKSPVGATVHAAMKSLMRFPGDRARAQEIATQTALDQITDMARHLRFLEATVQAAPMLGLLGTVVGMISSFGELSRSGGAIEPAALATGIWAALLTTAAGLAIAIPFYFIWTWLDSRVEAERSMMEAAIGAVLFAENQDAAPRPAATMTDFAPDAPRPAKV